MKTQSKRLAPAPDTQRFAEGRRGTRTHRGFMRSMCYGNYIAGGMASVFASPKQVKAAARALSAGLAVNQVQGRIVRAVMRAQLADACETAESLYL